MQNIDLSAVSKSSLKTMFPTLQFSEIAVPDMSVSGNFFGDDVQHEDLERATLHLNSFQLKFPKALLANGYLEERSFYNTHNYEREGPNGTEYRNIHLGTDFWVPAATPLHAPLGGTVVIAHHNDIHKDYGPLLVLEHSVNDSVFYTLYGHLSVETLTLSPKGKYVGKGEPLGWIGNKEENGHWVPHLHFQIITDLWGQTENFNGTAYPSELPYWKSICPNPNLLFREKF